MDYAYGMVSGYVTQNKTFIIESTVLHPRHQKLLQKIVRNKITLRLENFN